MGPETLIEDLIPFMDHGPSDPSAGQMAYSMGTKRKAREDAAAAEVSAPSATLTEEEQMTMALTLSMQV